MSLSHKFERIAEEFMREEGLNCEKMLPIVGALFDEIIHRLGFTNAPYTQVAKKMIEVYHGESK